MASSFVTKGSAVISATKEGSSDKIALSGITSADSITPDIAVTQMNKILDVVNLSVSTTNMTRSITQEAISNE